MSGFSEELFITLLCCCCLVLRLKTSGSLEAFEEVEVRDLVQLMTCLRSWLANTRSLQRFKLWPHFMDWIRFHIGVDSLFPMHLQLLMWELFVGLREFGGGEGRHLLIANYPIVATLPL